MSEPTEYKWECGKVNGGNPIVTSYYDSPDMPTPVENREPTETPVETSPE